METLEESIYAYFEAVQTGNSKQLSAYLPLKLFKPAQGQDKPPMLKNATGEFKNFLFDKNNPVVFSAMSIDKISYSGEGDVHVLSGPQASDYAVVNYSYRMLKTFAPVEKDAIDPMKAYWEALQQLEQTKKAAVIQEKERIIAMHIQSTLWAIKAQGSFDMPWQFIDWSKESLPFLKQILPKELYRALIKLNK